MFPSFIMKFTNHQTKQDQILLNILQQNLLHLYQIPISVDSLFAALSQCFLLNLNEKATLFKMCENLISNIELSSLISIDQVPEKLRGFISQPQLVQEYLKNPFQRIFEKVTLEMASILFQTKIQVFYLHDDMSLHSLIINNRYKKQIGLLQQGPHYDTVYTEDQLEGIQISYSIIQELLMNSLEIILDNKNFVNKNQNIFIDQENYIQDKYRLNSDSFNEIEDDYFNTKIFDIFSQNKIFTKLQWNHFGLPQYNSSAQEALSFDSSSPRQLNNLLDFEHKELNQSNIEKQIQSTKYHTLLREQLIEEINQEGDELMNECNKLLDDISKISETSTDHPEQKSRKSLKPLDSKNCQKKNLEISQSEKKENEFIHPGRFTGRLKFFDEPKNYGFIVMDSDGTDIFVHFDDLQKAGITKEILRQAKNGNMLRFSFNCMKYIGKYNQSRKAVEVQLIPSLPHPQPNFYLQMMSIPMYNQANYPIH